MPYTTCPNCRGSGKDFHTHICIYCKGSGKVWKSNKEKKQKRWF